MSTIHETITNSVPLPAGAGTYVNRAVAALEEREVGIAEALISFATEKGLSEADAKAALADAGLSVPTDPEPEPVNVQGNESVTVGGEQTDLVSLVSRLAGQVEALASRVDGALAAARSRGIHL